MTDNRLSRLDWIKAGLKALAHTGVNALKADNLAKELGVSRGSFYWHFADVNAFQIAILEAWENQATVQIIEQVEAVQGSVQEKVHLLAQITFSTEGALERQVRAWASQQEIASVVQERVDRARVNFVTQLFEQAGFDRRTALLHARFFYLALVGRFAVGKRFELEPAEIANLVDKLMKRN